MTTVANDHRTPAAAGPVPIDHQHLARYTLGNRSLEVEILQLFAEQAPQTLDQLKAADDARSWHAAAHTLKGSAKAVGACALASTAETAERAGYGSAEPQRLIFEVEQSLVEVLDYIAQLAEPA